MLHDLGLIVERYYSWIKISEDEMREMHGNKRHGYSLVYHVSDITIAKYFNGQVIAGMTYGHDLKLLSIGNPDCSYVINSSFMIRVDKNSFWINVWNGDRIICSAFTDNNGRSVGTNVNWDSNGVCKLSRFSKE
jgi:hypothetical protein